MLKDYLFPKYVYLGVKLAVVLYVCLNVVFRPIIVVVGA
jgi:hypothetical protein